MDQLYFTLNVLLWLVGIPLALGFWKKLTIAETIQVNRATDNEEHMVFTKSFGHFDSAEHKRKSLNRLLKMSDDRREHNHKKFQEVIAAAEKANADKASKLKSV